MEALGQAAKEVPAGTAMGAYLQEIRASGEGRVPVAALLKLLVEAARGGGNAPLPSSN